MTQITESDPLLSPTSGDSSTHPEQDYGALEDQSAENTHSSIDITSAKFTWTYAYKESRTIVHLAWPVLVSYILSMSLTLAAVFSLGHVGTSELAASALATMWCNVSGLSVGQGFASALDTLCSQSHTGSEDRFAVGKHLQRAVIMMAFLCIPILTIWSFTEPLLLLLGQEPQIAALAGEFVFWMMPGLYPYLVNDCIKRYLQGQGIMKANLYVTLIASPVNVFLQWFLVWSPYAIGVKGAPLASTLTNCLMMSLSILYVAFIDGYQGWGGWDWSEALDWKQHKLLFSLGGPGVMMLCAEWWAFEVISLAAGLLGSDILAAQTIVLNTCSLTYMVPLGLSIATTTRIGNLLGSNHANRARQSAMTALLLSVVFALLNTSFLMIVKPVWGYVWTSDETVVRLVEGILPLAAIFQLADGTSGVGGGVLRGSGRQSLGAIINFSGYYLLGLPGAMVLAFVLHQGLFGLWFSLTAGIFTIAVIQLILILRTDWDLEALRARKRINAVNEASNARCSEEEENLLEDDATA